MAPVGMDDYQRETLEQETLGETFASAEARFAYERSRRLRTVLKIVGALTVLVLFGLGMYRLGGGQFGGHSIDDGHGHDHGGDALSVPLAVDPIGSPEAKVNVVGIMPEGSNCHAQIIKFINEIALTRPDKIRAEFYTVNEYGRQKLSREIGQICAAVMINGKTTFDVIYEGKEHKISLIGTEPTHYTLGDVGEAITHEYVAQYGDPGEPIYSVAPGAAPGMTASGEDEGDHAGHDHETPDEVMELPGFKGIGTGD